MKIFLTAVALLLSLGIAIFPDISLAAAREALVMCSNIVVPSLFPFFVCSNLLIALGISEYLSKGFGRFMRPVFKIGGSGALALFLGLLSGYPCGAATTCRLYSEGSLTKNEAERLLAFSNNSGPLFIISAVGIGIYHSQAVGLILYISHVAGALLTGVFLRFFADGAERKPHFSAAQKTSVLTAVGDSVISIITLCGYIVFFAVILSILKRTFVISLFEKALLLVGVNEADSALLSSGFFEITSGINASHSVNLPYVSLILSLGGLSVFLQTYSFVHKCALSVKPYIFGKLLSGGFSAICTKILLYFFPIATATFSPLSAEGVKLFLNYFSYSLTAFFIFLIFYLFCKTKPSA